MNKRFLALAGVATVLSVGTYVGLNIVKPYKHEEPKVADVTSPDQVFGASTANPEAHADETAVAPASDAAAAAAVQPADTSVQPASTGAPSATASSDGSVAPLVPAGPAGTTPAASTETAAAAPAPAAEPAAEPAPAPAPAAEEAPAPAPVAEAAPVEKPKKAKKNPAHAAYKAAKSDAPKVWWPAEKADKLSLQFAGPASYKQAVVLMFNGAFFKADSVNANIKVTNKAGKAVAGTWELGANNLHMVVFPVSAAGTYKVSIAPGLTDNKGRKLGAKLSGPVVVH